MILILEDNSDLLYLMKKTFGSIFHDRCIASKNVKDALKYALSEDIKLVLSDIDLEGESGIDFLRKIRIVKPHSVPPIVVFTGLNRNDKKYQIASNLCDAIYEKGETPLLQLCRGLHDLIH